MKRMSGFIKWLSLGLFMTGCTSMCEKSHEDMSAEEVVESYLDFALNITDVEQKDELMEFTTGNLEAALAGADTDTFKRAYVDRKYNLTRFSILERRDRTPRETEITFQITYRDIPKDETKSADAPEVTTENTVAVIKEKNRWLVREVIGNKTTFDFPVSELSNITAKAGDNTGSGAAPQQSEDPDDGS